MASLAPIVGHACRTRSVRPACVVISVPTLSVTTQRFHAVVVVSIMIICSDGCRSPRRPLREILMASTLVLTGSRQ
jgi:hypothetical protein